MSDQLGQPFSKSAMTEEELKQTNRDQKHQVIAFVFMIFLTIIAFVTIGTGIAPSSFAIPFILILAVIQLILQLTYFMHLKDKGHTWPSTFISSGLVISIPCIAGLILLLGIVKY